MDFHSIVTKHFSRPIVMLATEPMVTAIAFYASFVFALLYTTLEVFPIVFLQYRHWSLLVSTLPFISLFVGVLAAVVLSLLGVDEPTVVADYALSGAAMLRLRAKLIQKYPEGRETLENIDEVFSADPAQMEQLLEHINEQYGSVSSYVEGLGAAPGLVERLRAALLEPRP